MGVGDLQNTSCRAFLFYGRSQNDYPARNIIHGIIFTVTRKDKTLPVLQIQGKQCCGGRPCLALRPARAFAFGQGVRGTALGGVRPWCRLPERVAREWNSPQHCFRLRWAQSMSSARPPKGEMLPVLQIQRNSAWGRPCLALRPARALAFGQGVRGAALGDVRLGGLPSRACGTAAPHDHLRRPRVPRRT